MTEKEKFPYSFGYVFTPSLQSYRVSRKSCDFQNFMSDILGIRRFAKGMAV